MEIEFRDEHLRKICEIERYAVKQLGSPCAEKLKIRISDIFAASNVRELPSGRPHALEGKRKGQYAVELHGGLRLIFVAANQPTPLVGKDNVDWSRVTKIKIIEVEDYHA